MEITKSQMKDLVKAWESHVANDTRCGFCPDCDCPIHKFFMKMKLKL